MTREDAHLIPGCSIPKTSGVISTACEDILAIRRISYAGQVAAVSGQYVQGLPTGDIPDASRLIPTAADDGLTVR